jgi:N-acetylmuramoyl-L-alanine amidase
MSKQVLKMGFLKGRKTALFITAVTCIFVGTLIATVYSIYLQETPARRNIAGAPQQFRLVVDAGHGGNDEGSKYNNIKEKDITLAIAKQIKLLAPQYGIDIAMTREGDNFINPPGRINVAEHENANAYVSIHVNELKGYSYVSGMQVYVSNRNPQFEQSCVLGSAVSKSLSEKFKVFGKLQDRAKNIYVLSENSLPSVLVECGFITNAQDAKMLTDSTEEKLIAKQILEGVAAYKNHSVPQLYAVQLPHWADTVKSKRIIASARGITPRRKAKKGNRLT